jgi:hypothetical protein
MRLATALILCAALPVFPAAGQTMKAGLWEIHQTPQLPPDQQAKMEAAQRQMAAMPPDQRKMVEQMMAQHGVQMNMAGGTITIKSCVSKEQAERNAPPVTDGKSHCSHDVQRSGNVIRTHFSCTDPASEGDSEVTLQGGDGFTSKTRITHQRNGKPETITVSGDAHWLGSDCGGLKPVDLPRK